MPNKNIEYLGKYHVINEVGNDRFSIIYRAEHPFLKKTVTVKLFNPEYFKSPEIIQAFIREIKAAVSIKHENISPVIDLLEDQNHLIMVLEYQTKGNLRQRLIQQGRVSFHQVAKIISEIATALDYIHSKGYIHGDINPEYILFGDDDIAKLTDTGVLHAAASCGALTQEMAQTTPQYISPEQANGEQPTTLSDQYSLGVIAYELFTGKIPFSGNTPIEIYLKQVKETPPIASKVNPLITPELEEILNQVLSKDPHKRFVDCSSFARAIDAAEGTTEDDQYRSLIERATAALSANDPESAHPLLEFATQLMPDNPGDRALLEDLKANELAQRSYKNAIDAIESARNSAEEFTKQVNLSSDPDGIITNLKPQKASPWMAQILRWKFSFLTIIALGLLGIILGLAGMAYTAIMPADTTSKATLVAIARTSTPIPPTAIPTQTFTPTSTSTQAPTFTPTSLPTATAIPTLGQGSNTIRKIDGMKMAYVPEGSFTMGSEIKSDEKPVQTVSLDAFWIDQIEVTNAMYALCVEAGSCPPQVSNASSSRSNYYTDPVFANYPVIHVTWNQAITYCTWTGGRLPTEAEWEKAARGTDGRTYPWGEIIDKSLANYSRSVSDTSYGGNYKSGISPYGVFDLSGNVSEWVSSLYKPYPYNSTDGREDLNASGARVLRGGSWFDIDKDVRSAARIKLLPSNQSDHFGFRCVVTP
ncbi:MAG: SUMF1/EgtB/PvdO family nonheme iron enzyme [Chloroflexota bacterium]